MTPFANVAVSASSLTTTGAVNSAGSTAWTQIANVITAKNFATFSIRSMLPKIVLVCTTKYDDFRFHIIHKGLSALNIMRNKSIWSYFSVKAIFAPFLMSS
jgi:hypothetical protein